MARSLQKDPSIKQANDVSCFNSRFGRGRRAKTYSNKIDRRILKKDLQARLYQDYGQAKIL